MGLKSFVFFASCRSLEVFILIGLKSFVLIQIRDILQVFILQGLQEHTLGSGDSKGVSGCNRHANPESVPLKWKKRRVTAL